MDERTEGVLNKIRALERSLQRPAHGVFTEEELDGLPDPVRRMFQRAIPLGAPLATSARITMHGRIRLRNWTRFTGTEVIAPGAGFVWAVRAGVISGYDRFINGEGEMRWKLLGLVPVMKGSGADISRSAAGRVGGEAVWVPTAILPRFGVTWDAVDDHHITARLLLGGHELEYHYALDDDARITTTWFDRWGDPDNTGAYALHPFGVETTSFGRFSGITVPSAGRAGWHFKTDRWHEGVFFEYEITNLHPYPAAGGSALREASPGPASEPA